MIAEPAQPPAASPEPHVEARPGRGRILDAQPSPPARAEGVLRWPDSLVARLDSLVHRAIPPSLNPFTQSGAIANTAFLVAAATGILLLFWYSPSVYNAYDSLEKIREGSWLGQLMRSLHRYSSDVCMLFILVHVFRVVVSRRIFGARWLPWVTGVGLLGTVWLIGWTGYWLVWDLRAQHVAEGSARFMDVLPIFGQPLASAFLTNETVPSLLFFLVFFAHMLLPLAIGIGLWLHLSRLNRPKLLTNRHLTAWILGTMLVLSIVFPATSAARADMPALSEGFTMDWWYLWPLWFTDRLSGGAAWALSFAGTVVFASVPWWMKKRGAPKRVAVAEVDVPSCNGCTLCSKDCPFDAISMVSRQDGKPVGVQSQVDPDHCVGCGICVGACDSDAINLPWLNTKVEKERIDAWVNEKLSREERPMLAFICAESAGAAFPVNAVTGDCPLLPGYRVRAVPCAGWVSARLIEHCLNNGAAGVLIAGCAPGEPAFREGADWLRDRIDGKRRPIVRKQKADISRVRFVRLSRAHPRELIAVAEDFRAGRARTEKKRARLAGSIAGVGIAAVLAAVTAIGSALPYSPPSMEPELVISFRHLAERMEVARELTAEERERLPVHMRGDAVTSRKRAPVRMNVSVGDEVVLDCAYPPRGLHSDGPSVVMERIALPPGRHFVSIQIGDTPDADEWSRHWSGTVEILPERRRVILFEGERGFRLE